MSDTPEPPDLEVNIPVPEGLRVTREDQPYHILLVTDLAGSDSGSLSGPLNEGVVPVTADSLAELMQAAKPSVSYKTTDPLASGNVMVEVQLAFDSLKDFEPKALVSQIPAAPALMGVRSKIVDRMHGKLDSEGLSASAASAIQADPELAWLSEVLKWTPAAPAADSGAVDDVLGQLNLGDDTSDASESPPKTPVGRLVAAAAGGDAIPSEEASACRRALAEIDRRLSAWVTAVLHAPEVQSIEAAWRSLTFLVSKIEFRKGVRLSVLHVPGGDLLERFRTLLIDPVFDEGVAAPDLIVVDRQFGQSAADVEAVDELAQHAASLPALALTGVSPSFFGVKHAFQIATLPTLTNLFDQWQFAKWKTLRMQPYARNLGVVFGRCLLRAPYRRGDAQDLEFSYNEPCITDKDLVWAGGTVAAACTIARSVAETGWPTGAAGYVHGRLEGFKTAEGGKKGDKKFGPSDTRLVESKIEELGMAGVNAAVGILDHDDILVWNGMTAASAPRNDTGAILEVSLPYQLFACRLSALLFLLKPHLAGLSGDKLVQFVASHIRAWVLFEGDATPEQVSVQTRPVEDDKTATEMAVTVTPPPSLLPGSVPMVMGYRVG